MALTSVRASLPDWAIAAIALTVIVIAIAAAYWPALKGGVIFDDDLNIMLPTVRLPSGLPKIWLKPQSTQQYYPVLYSAIWLEHRLWGDEVLGFHLVNVVCHAISSLLVFFILRRLKIPGALFGAALFALHPVMVESVAWMTEQKNTLSTVFYLAALLTYLAFDESRRGWQYGVSLALFALALLSKSATVTLPFTLLVICWWKRGAISWKRDLLPLIPFIALSVAMGVVTIIIERMMMNDDKTIIRLTFAERFLLAGRAVWFYLAKLIWPANLIFIYPKWSLDARAAWQWLFPVAAIAMTLGLWLLRNRTRAPLAAWLIYCGTLAPILGFLNVSFFDLSYVADHFQYLASLAMFALFAGVLATPLRRLNPPWRWAAKTAGVAIIALFAVLSENQSTFYADPMHFYLTLIDRNPNCAMAHNNLAPLFFMQGKTKESIEQLNAAIKIDPNDVDAYCNLGVAYTKLGQLDVAIQNYEKSAQLNPDHAGAVHKLGLMYLDLKRYDDAIKTFRRILKKNPDAVPARVSLVDALFLIGHPDEAEKELQTILDTAPDDVDNLATLGGNLYHLRRFKDAIPPLEAVIRLAPDRHDAHFVLAECYLEMAATEQAIEHYKICLNLHPEVLAAYSGLVKALIKVNRDAEAAATAEKGIAAARSQHDETSAQEIEDWLKHYRKELERSKADPAATQK